MFWFDLQEKKFKYVPSFSFYVINISTAASTPWPPYPSV